MSATSTDLEPGARVVLSYTAFAAHIHPWQRWKDRVGTVTRTKNDGALVFVRWDGNGRQSVYSYAASFIEREPADNQPPARERV